MDKTTRQDVYTELGSVIAEIHNEILFSMKLNDLSRGKEILIVLIDALNTIRNTGSMA
jgi:hypothetical protein